MHAPDITLVDARVGSFRRRLQYLFRVGWLIVLLGGVGVAGTCRAESSADALEYRIKTAFVCKFASYVEWPAQAFERPDSPIVIGVIASDAVADELTRTATGLSAGGRALLVRRFRRGEPVAGAHLVYIARSEESVLAETIAALKGQPVLVVTESRGAIEAGSMVNFVVVEDKVRFDIAPQVADLSHLRISARLLSVARMLVGRAS
jgi:hypothetical protein